MDPADNPDYLRALAEAVTAFREELVAFLEMHVANTFMARGLAPAVLPRDDADPVAIAAQRSRVARAAGRTGGAVGLTQMYIAVQGRGLIDPIAAWENMTQPKPLLEPTDVLGACDQMLGRLEGMIVKAEAQRPPTIGAEAMHPLIWGAARRLWLDRHYRQAVSAAADALVGNVKSLTGRTDLPETSLWQQVFSKDAPAPSSPRLRWPGPSSDRNVISMNDGLRQYAPGVQMTIRNPAAHDAVDLDEQLALERLAALSLLARWVDACELVEITQE